MHPALQQIVSNTRALLLPPRPLTVSQWADTYRKLSPEASAEPGQWKTSRAEYQRGILDAFSDPSVHTVVCMTSAQVGKTEILNNTAAFFIDHDPCPILVLQPTLEMAEAWSKDRLAPMLRDTPALQGKIKDARARDSGNTLLHKSFPGGHITMAGANSPASLASRPIRAVLCDEVDRYPASAGTEGDPVNLAKKRTSTFWNKKLGLYSTPTLKGQSRIENAFGDSDMRYYYVPCQHCGHEQRLLWKNVKWADGDASTAAYACEECGALWSDGERYRAIRRGRWVATRPFKGIAGFHLSELYSPWRKLSDTVEDFQAAKRGGPELLKVWTNTALGETWEQTGAERVDPDSLQARAEAYAPLTVPPGGYILTAGVDTQNDRLAVVIRAWGRGEESWLVWTGELMGDPSEYAVFEQLDELLDRTYPTASGHDLPISAAVIDTGGQRTQSVYDYVRRARKAGRPVYAGKGSRDRQAPIFKRPTPQDIHLNGKVMKGAVQLYSLGVHMIKDVLSARMKKAEGPGALHWYAAGTDYFEQMTSEVAVQRFEMGQPYFAWQKLKNSTRNEAWDCEVYAIAAARLIGVERADWDRIAARFAPAEPADAHEIDGGSYTDESAEEAPDPQAAKQARQRKRFRVVGRAGGLK